MPIARVQHTYNHINGLAEDAVVNSFYFAELDQTLGVEVADATALSALVLDFYDAAPVGGTPVSANISEVGMAAQRHGIKVYDELAPKPSVPVYSTATNNGRANNSTAAYPAEVAICMSFRGKLTSGVPAARRRGRVYLGPLTTTSGSVAETPGHVRPGPFRDNILNAGKRLALAANTLGYRWCVRSTVLVGGSNPNGIYTDVTHVWVDNAFDTQRRRGPKPTTRLSTDFVGDIVGAN